ncbi:MAG: mandelate racemase [Alphaproteobacteria bacterium]|jgi:mandelate racemase|nr:mandelate racemase [Alphaproteobacteria bacterium]MBT7943740.1 mandelate racemase [Alphaproteobacteria bacterium]
MSGDALTIKGLTLRTVVVPLRRPLVTRVVTIQNAAFVLIDLETEQGVTGRSYLFGYSAPGAACLIPPLKWLGDAMTGRTIEPETLFDDARKALTLMGHEGIAMMAVSGFDMACWDAYARAQDKPLAEVLGGTLEPVQAYNSNGLGLIDADTAAREAIELLAEGNFAAVKVRQGRETLEDDLAVFRAVRDAVGPDVLLPVDFNQGLDVEEAIQRGRALDSEDVYWIEEPTRYDDWTGNARIAAAVETPIQNGENFYGPEGAARAIEAGALDYLMPDVERIGGVTGWLRTAKIAEAADMPVSSHLFPEFSSHLLAVTPTRHWLEYTDWAAPLLKDPYQVIDGHIHFPDAPGVGIDWNEDAVEKYSVLR